MAHEETNKTRKCETCPVSAVSVELVNPLLVIVSYADHLMDDGRCTSNNRVLLERIKANALYAKALTEGIGDLTLVEGGTLKVSVSDFDLMIHVQEALVSSRLSAEKKGLKFDLDFASGVPSRVQTDHRLLARIIQNIVDNAVKYTQQGSIKIRVSFSPKESLVNVSVEDTGIGIPADQRSRLFHICGRTDNAKRLATGTGLSLFLAKRFALALGGDVRLVRSVVGQGSEFNVSFKTGHDPATPPLTT